MASIKYNKLIRDKIPEIIEKSGKQAIVERVEGDQLLELLNKKLFEELEEYNESGEIEELADLALESDSIKIAIEIDGETYHNPKKVSDNKYYYDLLK